MGSGVAGGASDWVAGRAGLWVVVVSPQILEHPTSICDTGVNLVKLRLTSIYICLELRSDPSAKFLK